MKVELLDAATVSDADIAAWHRCADSAYIALWPDEPPPPLGYHVERVRNPGAVRPYRVFVAWDDARERVLGAAETWWWDGANGHRILTDLYVEPSERRRGVGRALVEALTAAGRADGRTAVLGGARRDTAGVDFATTLGARFGLDEFRSRLLLREARLDAAQHPGFGIVRWQDHCPDEWVESYCRMCEVMNTAPQGGDIRWNDDTWTRERLRSTEADSRAKRLMRYTLCAVDEATGELVAHTTVQVFDTWPEVGEQDDTAVNPAYRGRGLAKLVKTEMARWLQKQHPELVLLSTWNAVTNDAMLAVNAGLGYGNRERWAEVELVIG